MALLEVGLVDRLEGVSADQAAPCVMPARRLRATLVLAALAVVKAVAGNNLGPAVAMVPCLVAGVTMRGLGLVVVVVAVVVAGRERVLAEVAPMVVVVAAMRAGAQRILAVAVVPAALAAVHRLEAPRTTTPGCSLR